MNARCGTTVIPLPQRSPTLCNDIPSIYPRARSSMLKRSGRAAAKRARAPDQRPQKRRNAKGDVGALPEWDLSDLYPGLDSPEITGDLARSGARCLAFEEHYKGQLEDHVEQLFNEKAGSGQGAWNRFFDDTVAGLRFKVGAKTLPIEPTLSLLQDRDATTRKAAAAALGRTFAQNLRVFTLITNTL